MSKASFPVLANRTGFQRRVLTRRNVCLLWLVLLVCFVPIQAEMPPAATALLDRMTGNWVLRGTIAGKPTTHDVQAKWVLNREYLQLHEISREKDTGGGAAYEAIVYIGWDTKKAQYTCLWLDSTSGEGLSSEVIGRGNQAGDAIPFVFQLSASDEIRTTFSYDKAAGTWRWLIDNVVNGKTQRFADVKLTRAR